MRSWEQLRSFHRNHRLMVGWLVRNHMRLVFRHWVSKKTCKNCGHEIGGREKVDVNFYLVTILPSLFLCLSRGLAEDSRDIWWFWWVNALDTAWWTEAWDVDITGNIGDLTEHTLASAVEIIDNITAIGWWCKCCCNWFCAWCFSGDDLIRIAKAAFEGFDRIQLKLIHNLKRGF